MWESEEHLTHEMKRCEDEEEVVERGFSKNSKQWGQNVDGLRRRTQEVQIRRSRPRTTALWRSQRSLTLQLQQSPLTKGKMLRGDWTCESDWEGFDDGRFIAVIEFWGFGILGFWNCDRGDLSVFLGFGRKKKKM
jgi:hypothetical protein